MVDIIKRREQINRSAKKFRAKQRLIKYQGGDYSVFGFTREKDLEFLGLTLQEAREKFNLPYNEKDNPEPSKEVSEETETRTETNKPPKQGELQNNKEKGQEIKPTAELFVQDKEEKEPKTNCCDDEDNWCWLDANDARENEAIKLGYKEVCAKCYNLR